MPIATFCRNSEKGVTVEELARQLHLPIGQVMYVPLATMCSVQAVLYSGMLQKTNICLFVNVWFCREAIKPLEQEGLLYNTIDERHYKSTANG